MPTQTQSDTQRTGDAFVFGGSLAMLTAEDATIAQAAWERWSPVQSADLLAAAPIDAALVTYTATIQSATRSAVLTPFGIGEAFKLEWDSGSRRWIDAGATLSTGFTFRLSTSAGAWVGNAARGASSVVLRSTMPGTITVSLTRSTPIAAFLVGLSAYRWNEATVRFISPTGKLVSPNALKQAINTVTRNAQAEFATLTGRMNAGEISIGEWQTQAAQHVKAVHTAADVAAQGGWSQLTPDDVARVEETIRYQLGRLQVLANEVAADDLKLSGPRAIARAKLFDASASSGTFEASNADNWAAKVAAGVAVEEINVLGDAEHCEPTPGRPGCKAETERGWVPYGTLSRPGQRSCVVNCRCRVDRRRKI